MRFLDGIRGWKTFGRAARRRIVRCVAARRAAILALGLPFLAAEREGAVAGYAYAGAYRPRPAYRFTVEDSIYIAPQHAARGCGTRPRHPISDAVD